MRGSRPYTVHIHCWCLLVLSDGQEEERDEREAVIQDEVHFASMSVLVTTPSSSGSITFVLLLPLVRAQLVEHFDLLHNLVVKPDDIFRANVFAAILFE